MLGFEKKFALIAIMVYVLNKYAFYSVEFPSFIFELYMALV